ncbi:MAG: hypothetical protein JNG89_00125 [Planctomycetaceae bacterium]|nr:hypothetical protein [Planctomycetaceae bacterium]
MADETFSKSTSPTVTHYAFELVPAKACEEGPPQMAISVLDGKIVGCYIGCPEF